MKGTSLFGLLAVISIVSLLVVGVTMYFSYSNKYVTLKNMYDAQLDKDRITYDEVWKVIKQQAGVSEKYSEDFRKNYQAIMASRNYGGEMMKWITEQNPNFTPDLYSKLMTTIEVQRANFTANQTKLIAIHKEIKDLVMKFPSSLFVGGREVPELTLVTSTQTEEVFKTQKDDSVKLFN